MEPLRVGDHKIVNLQAFRETKGGAYAYGCDDFIDASGILSVEVASERAWLTGREQLGREQNSEKKLKDANHCPSLNWLWRYSSTIKPWGLRWERLMGLMSRTVWNWPSSRTSVVWESAFVWKYTWTLSTG